jgi:hypothetical protein
MFPLGSTYPRRNLAHNFGTPRGSAQTGRELLVTAKFTSSAVSTSVPSTTGMLIRHAVLLVVDAE